MDGDWRTSFLILNIFIYLFIYNTNEFDIKINISCIGGGSHVYGGMAGKRSYDMSVCRDVWLIQIRLWYVCVYDRM